jgi:hypothetical protein
MRAVEGWSCVRASAPNHGRVAATSATIPRSTANDPVMNKNAYTASSPVPRVAFRRGAAARCEHVRVRGLCPTCAGDWITHLMHKSVLNVHTGVGYENRSEDRFFYNFSYRPEKIRGPSRNPRRPTGPPCNRLFLSCILRCNESPALSHARHRLGADIAQ